MNSKDENLSGKHNFHFYLSFATVTLTLYHDHQNRYENSKINGGYHPVNTAHTHTHTHTHRDLHTHTHTHSQAKHTHTHTHTLHMYMQSQPYTHMHACARAHTHTHTHLFTPVSFRQHDHTAPSCLELIHIGIHPACCCWTKRSTGITLVTHKTDDGAPFH